MGGMMPAPKNYNIREVYDYCDVSTPAVFLLPDPDKDPEHDLSTSGNNESSFIRFITIIKGV